MKIAALIVAAGRGTRAGGPVPKQWQMIAGKRVIDWTIDAFSNHPSVTHIMVVLHPDDHGLITDPAISTTSGGATRDQSVKAGLRALAVFEPDIVLIHDAARATIPHDVISGVIDALGFAKAAAPAIAVTDALWLGQDGIVKDIKPRSGLFRAQTPQGFHFQSILDAHDKVKISAADDVEIAHLAGIPVQITQGCESNLKITTPQDFARAQDILLKRTE